MWPSLRGTEVRHARRLSSKIGSHTHGNWDTTHGHLHILKTNLAPARGIKCHCISSSNLRFRSNPTDICLRRQFPHTKVPTSTKHNLAKCIHLSGNTCGACAPKLGCDFQARLGTSRGIVGVKFVVVDHSGGTIRVHFVE